MISELAKAREMTLGSRFSREARAGVLGKERERDEPAQQSLPLFQGEPIWGCQHSF